MRLDLVLTTLRLISGGHELRPINRESIKKCGALVAMSGALCATITQIILLLSHLRNNDQELMLFAAFVSVVVLRAKWNAPLYLVIVSCRPLYQGFRAEVVSSRKALVRGTAAG